MLIFHCPLYIFLYNKQYLLSLTLPSMNQYTVKQNKFFVTEYLPVNLLFFVFGTKSRLLELIFIYIQIFQMFCIKICLLEPEPSFYRWSQSRILFPWSRNRSQKKYLEPEQSKNGSAPQHWAIRQFYNLVLVLQVLFILGSNSSFIYLFYTSTGTGT